MAHMTTRATDALDEQTDQSIRRSIELGKYLIRPSKADINKTAWGVLYNDTSRPFAKP